MLTNYEGEPVEGGTYPALIWRDFMEDALPIVDPQGGGNEHNRRDQPGAAGKLTGDIGDLARHRTSATTPATVTPGAAVNTAPATTPAAPVTTPAAPVTTPAAPATTPARNSDPPEPRRLRPLRRPQPRLKPPPRPRPLHRATAAAIQASQAAAPGSAAADFHLSHEPAGPARRGRLKGERVLIENDCRSR